MAYHPEIQHGIAEITMALEGIEPHIETIARTWVEGGAGPTGS